MHGEKNMVISLIKWDMAKENAMLMQLTNTQLETCHQEPKRSPFASERCVSLIVRKRFGLSLIRCRSTEYTCSE